MIVTAVPARPIEAGMFAGITTVPVVRMQWGAGDLAVEFAADLTPAEAAAVRMRMECRNVNEEALRAQAIQALQNNRDFLNVASPTNAQTLAQVKALTRQSNGVIRMLLGQLDGID